jgi:hypothetical protein
LSLSDDTVTLAPGLTDNTTAEISCKLYGVERDVIQVVAYNEETPIPSYNTVSVSGYIQSKNTSSYVYVMVEGHHYEMSDDNTDELSFDTTVANNQSNNLDISTGIFNDIDNTVTYTVSIKPSSSTIDIAGNFALELNPTDPTITS